MLYTVPPSNTSAEKVGIISQGPTSNRLGSRLNLNEAATMKFVTAGTKECADIFFTAKASDRTKDRSRALG